MHISVRGKKTGASSSTNKGARPAVLVIMISNSFYKSINNNEEQPSLTGHSTPNP